MATPTTEEQFANQIESYPPVSEWQSSLTIQEQRSVLLIHPEDIPNSLTASTLSIANGLPISPFVFVDNEAGSLNALYYLGAGLAGHSGMMHGGLVAVLLDECMGCACFPLLESQGVVTAELKISYRAPMHVPGVVRIEAITEKVEGRKAWVKAWVKKLNISEVLIATATALFIERKAADSIKKLM